jgi:hypothetical protein
MSGFFIELAREVFMEPRLQAGSAMHVYEVSHERTDFFSIVQR